MADDVLTREALTELVAAHSKMVGLIKPYWSWVPTGIATEVDAIFAQLTDAETKLKQALGSQSIHHQGRNPDSGG